MMEFPTHNATFLIPGPTGQLEAMLEFPASTQIATPIVLICHPHPPDGGTMHNKVVSTLAKSFVESGYISVRFNFRGVGHSQGQYDYGVGELADCLAMMSWIQQQRPSAPLALAGFSFGAWVALKASEQMPAHLMVSVAPPVGFRDFSDVPRPQCPWLAVQGMQDEVVNAITVLQWLEQQSPRPEIIEMPDTSHFFHGKLLPLREHVKAFLQSQAHN